MTNVFCKCRDLSIGLERFIREQFCSTVGDRERLEECLWAHCLLPLARTAQPEQPLPEVTLIAGDYATAAETSGIIYTDGSGGPAWAHEPLRQVGSGAGVNLEVDLYVIFAMKVGVYILEGH